MAASMLSSESYIIHGLLLRSPPSSLSSFFSKLSLTSSAAFSTICFLQWKPTRSVFINRQYRYRCRTLAHSPSVAFTHPFSSNTSDSSKNEPSFEEDDEVEEDCESDSEDDVEIEDLEPGEAVVNGVVASNLSSSKLNRSVGKPPSLTVKEKKELASYAHSLGKKLKSQLVGKSGVTPNLASSFIETLEANELLKIKIHRTCPGELEDVVRQLEESTGSLAVDKIGRTIIIYRPSITKMKAEEKRRQARKMYVRKEPDRLKSILQSKEQLPRISNRGRRGSSRV